MPAPEPAMHGVKLRECSEVVGMSEKEAGRSLQLLPRSLVGVCGVRGSSSTGLTELKLSFDSAVVGDCTANGFV